MDNWRILSILTIFVLFFSAITYRLAFVQLFQADFYRAEAKSQQWKEEVIPANRGSIYFRDRLSNPILMAHDKTIYETFVYLPQLDAGFFGEEVKSNREQFFKEKIEGFAFKEGLFSLRDEFLERKEEFLTTQSQNFLLNVEFSKEDKEWLDENGFFEKDENGFFGPIRPKIVNGRHYPSKTIGSHVIGFLDRQNIANYGVESFCNDLLSPTEGRISGEKDSSGRFLTFGNKNEVLGKDGADVYLTIDYGLQLNIEKILKAGVERYGAASGSVIIVNPNNGDILSMANYPYFDPNEFGMVGQENEQGYRKFTNLSITDTYEPGSTFKPFIVAGALSDGVMDENTKYYDRTGYVEYEDGKKVYNSGKARYPVMDLQVIMEKSSNVGMANIVKNMSPEQIHKHLVDFGFGLHSGIDLAHESPGTLKPYDEWLDIDKATASFGQGLTVTSLQMAMAGSALANGGNLFLPRIIDKKLIDGNIVVQPSKMIKNVISREASIKTTSALVQSVDNGFAEAGAVEGYALAGKTGTGEIAKNGVYQRNGPYNASYLGYGPVSPGENVPLLVFVRLDRPTRPTFFASGTAAPLFSEVMSFALHYYNIPENR